MNYDHRKIEQKWQKYWAKNKTFQVENNLKKDDKKFYALDMFPYPSGEGLHVGHPLGMTATDIISRKKRHEGYKALHPMGWDAFGLPAENFAIKTGIHPKISTEKNSDNFRQQIKSLGFSYDWNREINTTDPNYYKWSQSIFLKLYKKGLAYEEEKEMNWCKSCKVVCANEEVESGMHERCGSKVEKKKLKQWMLRITDYAERLLQDLDSPNVFIIHGWEANKDSNWFSFLKISLEKSGCKVWLENFPNSKNPQYEEWKKFFKEKYLPHIKSNSILIGHSLGGTFLSRFLSEEKLQIGELILVAPPIDDCGISEIANFFPGKFPLNKNKESDQKCCSKGNTVGSDSKFYSILFSKLKEVKRKKNRKRFSQLKISIRNSQQDLILDGETLINHFNGKSPKERKSRIFLGKTVISALPELFYIEKLVGVFVSKDRVIKVIFSEVGENLIVKTYYESKKLTEEYQTWKKKISQENLPALNYSQIISSAEKITIYGSNDDGFTSQNKFENFANILGANFRFLKDEQHFCTEKFPELLKNIDKNILDWPHKIKAMQRNWIGKSEGVVFSSPTIYEYKKRGTKSSEKVACSQGCKNRSSLINSIIFSDVTEVKKKKCNQKIIKFKSEIQNSNKKIIFNGKNLWKHWEMKGAKERRIRQEFALTVLNSLEKIDFDKNLIGYFRCRNDIFRVIIDKIKDKYTVKTYYKDSDLSKQYKYKKKYNILEIRNFSAHFEAFMADTFFVIAPDHPLLNSLINTSKNKQEILEKCQEIISDRLNLGFEQEKESCGIFTGQYVMDPVNKKKIPIWVASFALSDYGTGIVKCSAHDERDFAFAKKYNIPLKTVLFPKDKQEAEKVKNLEYCYSDMKQGILTEPAIFSGKKGGDSRIDIIDFLEGKKLGKRKINYKLRDWIFTRQRYWGEPIPLVFDEQGKCYPLADSELPLKLPETPNYKPSNDGQSPLAKISDWVEVRGNLKKDGTVVISKNGKIKFSRETSTMPNWAGSSWYWLRFMDPHNDQNFCSKDAEEMWGSVDLYVGGAEHAVLHLLYARFWHKVLYDLKLVQTKEPFKKLVNQGMILSHAFENKNGGLVPVDEVTEKDGNFFHKNEIPVKRVIAKMSKSLKNVVNPDEIVQEFGADTLRCYEMFMGPFNQNKTWETKAVGGMRKWLDKVWRFFDGTKFSQENLLEQKNCSKNKYQKIIHQTISKVGQDIDDFKFNTALSQLMILFNELKDSQEISLEDARKVCLLISPLAPHLAEEIWTKKLLGKQTLAKEKWPSFDTKFLINDTVKYAVQINGKVRADFEFKKEGSKNEVLDFARKIDKVQKYLSEGEIKKEIFIPNKIVGFVVK